MTPTKLFAECETLGIDFGKKAVGYAQMLDELEERLWIAQENDESPPPWVQAMITAVGRKLASVMGEAE